MTRRELAVAFARVLLEAFDRHQRDERSFTVSIVPGDYVVARAEIGHASADFGVDPEELDDEEEAAEEVVTALVAACAKALPW